MKIKRFRARTFAEALETVKRELSDEAVILSTEEKKGLRPYVEVTAAVDYEQGIARRSQSKGISSEEMTFNTRTAGKSDNPEPFTLHSPSSLEDIKREIEKIKETLEDIRFSGFDFNLNEKRRKVFQILKTKGIKEEFALRLCEKARSIDGIVDAIRNDMDGIKGSVQSDPASRPSRTFSLFTPSRAIMLIGPTGVGKTTTVAKLASLAVRERKRVAIINLDNYRIGAPEQIRTYARILGIPIHMASNSKELKEGLRRFSGERDLVFIDTTGRNPRDEGYINELCSIVSDLHEEGGTSSILPLEVHLLMNTNSDSDYMIEAYRYYRLLPLNYIAFTKIDEAVRFGNIYNMIMTYQRPVSYITTGQKVPDDIEFPEIDRIAGLVLKG